MEMHSSDSFELPYLIFLIKVTKYNEFLFVSHWGCIYDHNQTSNIKCKGDHRTSLE